jgi:putative endonuclease
MGFVYVDILQSEVHPEYYYSGSTENLRDRLRRHNAGEVPHTAKYLRLCA